MRIHYSHVNELFYLRFKFSVHGIYSVIEHAKYMLDCQEVTNIICDICTYLIEHAKYMLDCQEVANIICDICTYFNIN